MLADWRNLSSLSVIIMLQKKRPHDFLSCLVWIAELSRQPTVSLSTPTWRTIVVSKTSKMRTNPSDNFRGSRMTTYRWAVDHSRTVLQKIGTLRVEGCRIVSLMLRRGL